MGQSAGLKRRKRRIGSYNLHQNKKGNRAKKMKLKNAGIKMMNIPEDVGKQCIMTRIEKNGLIANIDKFQPIDKRMLIRGKGEALESIKHKQNKKEDKQQNSNAIEALEEQRRKAKEKKFKNRKVSLPGPVVKMITYLLDRHGENYSAMVVDPMNYYQWTQAQIRDKVKSFKSTDTQFKDYLADRGLLPESALAQMKEKGQVERINDIDGEMRDSDSDNSENMEESESDSDEPVATETTPQEDGKKATKNQKRKMRAKRARQNKKKLINKNNRKLGLN